MVPTTSVPPIVPVAGAVTALTTRSGLTMVSGTLRTLLPSLVSLTAFRSSATATRNMRPAGASRGIVTAV